MMSNDYRGYVWITEILEIKEGKITNNVIDNKYNFRVYTIEGTKIETLDKDFPKFIKEFLDIADKKEVWLPPGTLSYDPPPDYKSPKENWREREFRMEDDFKKI